MVEEKIVTTGKRKMSVARATIKAGTGKIKINKMSYEYLPMMKRLMIQEPLEIAKEKLGNINFDINIVVKGGGQESRIEASRLAIAKALVKATGSNELKKTFLGYDKHLLIADTRRKEAYKPGDSKARSKRQKSYR